MVRVEDPREDGTVARGLGGSWNLRGKSTATFVRGIASSGRVRRDSASFRINQGGKHDSLGYRRVSDAQGGVHAPN